MTVYPWFFSTVFQSRCGLTFFSLHSRLTMSLKYSWNIFVNLSTCLMSIHVLWSITSMPIKYIFLLDMIYDIKQMPAASYGSSPFSIFNILNYIMWVFLNTRLSDLPLHSVFLKYKVLHNRANFFIPLRYIGLQLKISRWKVKFGPTARFQRTVYVDGLKLRGDTSTLVALEKEKEKWLYV